MSDSSNHPKEKKNPGARFRSASFPPAAIAGAFASFAGAVSGAAAREKVKTASKDSLVQIKPLNPKMPNTPLELEFECTGKLSGFAHRSLGGIAIGPSDRIYVLADGEVNIFEPDLTTVSKLKVPAGTTCISVDEKGSLIAGALGMVEICDADGNRRRSFAAGNPGHKAAITAVKSTGTEIYVADTAARCIHRHDANGRKLGEIGTQGKASGFMLPNRYLDFDVFADSTIAVNDPGRHRVTSWTKEGSAIGHFGKFGMMQPEDFVGCCNPVNITVTRDQKIVVGEKIAARVKIYDRKGKLLGLIGSEHFDPKCTHLHLAANAKGQILVADPVRLQIMLFSAVRKAGNRENV